MSSLANAPLTKKDWMQFNSLQNHCIIRERVGVTDKSNFKKPWRCLYDRVERTVHKLKKENTSFVSLQFVCEGLHHFWKTDIEKSSDGLPKINLTYFFQSISLNVTFYKNLSCIYTYVYRLLRFQKKKKKLDF